MNKTYRKVVRAAKRCPHGWALTQRRRSGHNRLSLPDGRFVTFPCTSSDVNGARNLARDLRRVCGCDSISAKG